jgi:hypothetical protein
VKTSALVVALAFVVLLAACGGDDDGGVAGTPGPATRHDPVQAELDYLDALEVVMEQAAADWQALEEEKASAFDSASGEVDAAQAALVLAGDHAAKATTRRDGITNIRPQPPATLQGMHLALGTAADDERVLADDIGVILADEPATDAAAYDALVVDLGGDVVVQRFVDACAAIQDYADSIDHDVDLHCGG